MRWCLQLAFFAARSDAPVLILGRTGTGKTLLAHALHNSSARAKGPFVSFNASAMSDTLLESELFGHECGAFTGAVHAHRGKFETAHTGTLFLDEIADMSPLAQAKILGAVEYDEFERVGG
jgi:transcriptional regulator with PAS, ATPase and Fis domain